MVRCNPHVLCFAAILFSPLHGGAFVRVATAAAEVTIDAKMSIVSATVDSPVETSVLEAFGVAGATAPAPLDETNVPSKQTGRAPLRDPDTPKPGKFEVQVANHVCALTSVGLTGDDLHVFEAFDIAVDECRRLPTCTGLTTGNTSDPLDTVYRLRSGVRHVADANVTSYEKICLEHSDRVTPMEPVAGVAFSRADPRFWATGAPDGHIQVWYRDRRKYNQKLHYGRVVSVQYSPDGTLIASAGADQRIVILDQTEAFRVVKTMSIDPRSPITAIAWSPGDGVGVGCADGRIFSFNMKSSTPTMVRDCFDCLGNNSQTPEPPRLWDSGHRRDANAALLLLCVLAALFLGFL